MQKYHAFGLAGLFLGLVIEFVGADSINRTATIAEPSSTTRAPLQNSTSRSQNSTGAKQPDVAETLSKAESEPQNFATQMQAGDIYARIGRFDKAVEFYRKGLTLNPKDARVNLVLANAFFDSRQFEEAAESYSKALELNPADTNARTDLGTTFVERQNPDFDRAIKEFEKVVEADPKHEAALFNLSMAYFRKGDAADAGRVAERLKQTTPSSELVERLKQNMATR